MSMRVIKAIDILSSQNILYSALKLLLVCVFVSHKKLCMKVETVPACACSSPPANELYLSRQ